MNTKKILITLALLLILVSNASAKLALVKVNGKTVCFHDSVCFCQTVSTSTTVNSEAMYFVDKGNKTPAMLQACKDLAAFKALPKTYVWKTYSKRGYKTIPVYLINPDGSKGLKIKTRVNTGLKCDTKVVQETRSKLIQYRGLHVNGSQRAVYCKRF